jgi:hypothetical protein
MASYDSKSLRESLEKATPESLSNSAEKSPAFTPATSTFVPLISARDQGIPSTGSVDTDLAKESHPISTPISTITETSIEDCGLLATEEARLEVEKDSVSIFTFLSKLNLKTVGFTLYRPFIKLAAVCQDSSWHRFLAMLLFVRGILMPLYYAMPTASATQAQAYGASWSSRWIWINQTCPAEQVCK